MLSKTWFKYEEALENFLIALKLNPDDIQTKINIGHAKIGLKEYEDAIEAVDFPKQLKLIKIISIATGAIALIGTIIILVLK